VSRFEAGRIAAVERHFAALAEDGDGLFDGEEFSALRVTRTVNEVLH
jgi:hypothetical protein